MSDDPPPPPTSVGALLDAAARELRPAAGDDARLEAEVLLAHALRSDRAHVLASLSQPAPRAAAAAFGDLLARRLARDPLAYIVGSREFFGLEIACAPGALIPRPETELLVEIAIDAARDAGRQVLLADVGTGTGAVAVAAASAIPDARVVATDTAAPALALARRNVARHAPGGRVQLVRCELLHGLRGFDVILANLPYLSEHEWRALPPEIREHEPRDALVAGQAGTEVNRALIAQAPAHLSPGGVLAVEIGAEQGVELHAAARAAFPDGRVSVIKDLAGLYRVVVVRRS